MVPGAAIKLVAPGRY